MLQARSCAEWPASIHCLQTTCVRADEGERVCLVRRMLFSQYRIMSPLFIAFRRCGGFWRSHFCFDVLLTTPEGSLTHSWGARLYLPVPQLSCKEPTPQTDKFLRHSCHVGFFFSITSLLIVGDNIPSTNEFLGRERSFSTSKNACEFNKSS